MSWLYNYSVSQTRHLTTHNLPFFLSFREQTFLMEPYFSRALEKFQEKRQNVPTEKKSLRIVLSIGTMMELCNLHSHAIRLTEFLLK